MVLNLQIKRFPGFKRSKKHFDYPKCAIKAFVTLTNHASSKKIEVQMHL
jgi:hypothetical protein